MYNNLVAGASGIYPRFNEWNKPIPYLGLEWKDIDWNEPILVGYNGRYVGLVPQGYTEYKPFRALGFFETQELKALLNVTLETQEREAYQMVWDYLQTIDVYEAPRDYDEGHDNDGC